MKIFLLFFFILILAAGAWLGINRVDPKLVLSQSSRDQLQAQLLQQARTQLEDKIEQAVWLIHEKFGHQTFMSKMEMRTGRCTPMDLPTPGSIKVGQIQPIPGAHVPFSQPFTLENMSLLCEFIGHGKPVLIQPTGKPVLTLRRAANQTGRISLADGEIQLISNQLEMELILPTVNLILKSDANVAATLHNINSQISVAVMSGTLDITVTKKENSDLMATSVLITVGPNTKLTSEGKLISDSKPVVLLPAGFQVQESDPLKVPVPVPGTPPAAIPVTPTATASTTATTTTAPVPVPAADSHGKP